MKCVDCKKRKGIVNFCNSVLGHTHGFGIQICRQCYIKRIEKGIKNSQKNLKEQKKLLKEGK